jgi:hypothetical protein
MLALCAIACYRRPEVKWSVDLEGEGRATSFVIVNLLDSEISVLALDYGVAPVQFSYLRVESGATVTRGNIAQLPRGGEIPTPPAANMVPVAVLLPTRLPVEWHDPDADITDLSRSLEEKYRKKSPGER